MLSERAKRLLELKVKLIESAPLCRTELERDTNSDVLLLVGWSIREELGNYVKQLRREVATPRRRTKPR
jgi:hypothetical protein